MKLTIPTAGALECARLDALINLSIEQFKTAFSFPSDYPSHRRPDDQKTVMGGKSSGPLVEDQQKFDRDSASIM